MSAVEEHLNASLALLVDGSRRMVRAGGADPLVIAQVQDAIFALQEAGADPAAEVDLGRVVGQDVEGRECIVRAASQLDMIKEDARTPRLLTARTEIAVVLMTVRE